MIAFKLLVLIGLVRLLIVTHKPLLCSSIYAVLVVLGNLFFGGSQVDAALVFGLIGFVTSTIYFWLLTRFDGSFIWWIILVAGALIGLV